jgi:hypothetical protein
MTLTRKSVTQLLYRGVDQPLASVQLWLLSDMEDLEQGRDIFWRCVKEQNLVLLEFLNDSIIGLAYQNGRSGILYDAHIALQLSQATWDLSPAVDVDTATAVAENNAQRWRGVLYGDFGEHSPWWAIV